MFPHKGKSGQIVVKTLIIERAESRILSQVFLMTGYTFARQRAVVSYSISHHLLDLRMAGKTIGRRWLSKIFMARQALARLGITTMRATQSSRYDGVAALVIDCQNDSLAQPTEAAIPE